MLELCVTIEPSSATYRASAEIRDHEPYAPIQVDDVQFDFELFDTFFRRQTSWVSRADERDSTRSARYLGQQLFQALFGGRLGAAYERARALSTEQGSGLLLRLALPREDRVLRLPWELLYESDSSLRRADFVALVLGTSIVRDRNERDPIHSNASLMPTVDRPLRWLIVTFEDDDFHPNIDREVNAIHEAAGKDSHVRVLRRTTIHQLVDELRDEQPHVLHY